MNKDEREVNAYERLLVCPISIYLCQRIQKATDASKAISDMCYIYK